MHWPGHFVRAPAFLPDHDWESIQGAELRRSVKAVQLGSAPAHYLFAAVVFIAVPVRGDAFRLILWIHRVAILALFLFLLAGEYCQMQASRQIRARRSTASVSRTMKRFRALSKLAPAPIALTIFLTGLRLIWEAPSQNSPSSVWLLVLIAGFSFFFFDGIFGYQVIVREMCIYWEQSAKQGLPASIAAQNWHSTSSRVQLLAHCWSWPIFVLFGVFRWNFANYASAVLGRLQNRFVFLPEGWPGVLVALLVWGVIGLLFILVRLLFPLLSRRLSQIRCRGGSHSSA